jgi:hypothetical protein
MHKTLPFFYFSTASPPLNTWHCVEVHWKKDSVNDVGELWVNGVKVPSLIGRNTAAYSAQADSVW